MLCIINSKTCSATLQHRSDSAGVKSDILWEDIRHAHSVAHATNAPTLLPQRPSSNAFPNIRVKHFGVNLKQGTRHTASPLLLVFDRLSLLFICAFHMVRPFVTIWQAQRTFSSRPFFHLITPTKKINKILFRSYYVANKYKKKL